MSKQTRFYQLICEGRCNEASLRQQYKAAMLVSAHAKMEFGGSQPCATSELKEVVRRLRYTPHVMSHQDVATCTQCNTSRTYGNTSTHFWGRNTRELRTEHGRH